MIYYSRWD